ncbi:DHH family protein [Clostridium cochlearium]|uniref:DHH family protein n=2 Tax=Clostridium cochlearium TaxID=1494 RepID=A0ABY0QL23_CLOCO|nr:DHH family protein [Clostridium cochlearium]
MANEYTLHDPFLMKGMDKALKRIVRAVNKREKIVVYGCYDLDGIAAVSVLFLVLKYLNADVEYFISDGKKDNFEINSDIVKNHVKFLGTNLMITAGCGSNSYDQVELCKRLGIDVIITDYHKCKCKVPNSIIINPNQDDCTYPFKDLTSSGVVYKLVQAISCYYQMKCVNKYLDLIMLGVLSTKPPYVGENKFIVEQGLYHMNFTNNYGLKALVKVNKEKRITFKNINKILENLMPSSNSSRMLANSRITVELFTTSNIDRAEQIVKYLKKEKKLVSNKQLIANSE